MFIALHWLDTFNPTPFIARQKSITM